MTEIEDRAKLSEDDRLERIREAESRPAVNPRYEGMTPGEMARALLRPRNPKIARVLDRLRKRNQE